MGAWDASAFGNDDACDFVLDLTENPDPIEFLTQVLEEAVGASYLEEPSGSHAVAAAALVALSVGAPIAAPEDAVAWLDGRRDLLKPLASHAERVIRRMASGESEIRERWLEADSAAEWLSHLDSIAAALSPEARP